MRAWAPVRSRACRVRVCVLCASTRARARTVLPSSVGAMSPPRGRRPRRACAQHGERRRRRSRRLQLRARDLGAHVGFGTGTSCASVDLRHELRTGAASYRDGAAAAMPARRGRRAADARVGAGAVDRVVTHTRVAPMRVVRVERAREREREEHARQHTVRKPCTQPQHTPARERIRVCTPPPRARDHLVRADSLSAFLSSVSSKCVTSDAARPCGPAGTASVRARTSPRVTTVLRRVCSRDRSSARSEARRAFQSARAGRVTAEDGRAQLVRPPARTSVLFGTCGVPAQARSSARRQDEMRARARNERTCTGVRARGREPAGKLVHVASAPCCGGAPSRRWQSAACRQARFAAARTPTGAAASGGGSAPRRARPRPSGARSRAPNRARPPAPGRGGPVGAA